MKLRMKDKVMVITGRDKGKTGEIVAVLPKANQVVVAGVNVAKRHTKPSQANPKGGIVELTKPIDANKVMAIDPASGRIARIGYKLGAKGQKERVFKVSKFQNKPVKKDTKKAAEAKDKGKKS